MNKKIEQLPKILIDNETKFLSQQDADRIFKTLNEKYPEQLKFIEPFVKYETLHPVDIKDSYIKVIDFIRFGTNDLATPQSQKIANTFSPIPQTELGLMDLTFELIRRARVGAGYREPAIKGKPIAKRPDGPFPEKLKAKTISKKALELGFKQCEIDSYVDQYYNENQEWCFITAEAWRRGFPPFHIKHGYEPSVDFFSKLFSEEKNQKLCKQRVAILKNETLERILKSADC